MRQATVAALLVVAACGDPTVTVTVTEQDGSAGIAVAVQDGDGAWRAVEGTAGRFSFDISQGRYGVAVWCAAALYRHVVFAYLTTDELTEVAMTGGCPLRNVTLRGTVRNFADNAEVAWSAVATTAGPTGAYSLRGPAGTHDVIATSFAPSAGGRTADALVILRDETVDGDRAINLDLAADPIALDTHDLTVAGALDDDFAVVSSAFHSAGRTTAVLGTASGDALTFQAVPGDALADGDRQSTFLQVTSAAVAGQPQRVRSHAAYTEASADLSIDLLPAIDPPTLSAGPTFAWTPLDDAEVYQLSVRQTDGGGAEHDYAGTWSPGYVGDDVVLATPDLSGVDGWDARVDLVDNATIFWSVSARTSNVSLGRLIAESAAGTAISATGWYGSVAP